MITSKKLPMNKRRKKPDKIIRTNRSEIHVYAHYEEDPENARQAKEAFDRGVQYVAKQGGWLDALEERDAAIVRLVQLFKEIEDRTAAITEIERQQNAKGM